MKKGILLVTIISIFSVICFSQSNEIKQNMLKRLPEINNLKNKGLIGENNKGYLEIRTDNRSMENIVSAENSDRTEVYKFIANKTKASVEMVGKARAEKIAENSPKGHWLQNPSGEWYRK